MTFVYRYVYFFNRLTAISPPTTCSSSIHSVASQRVKRSSSYAIRARCAKRYTATCTCCTRPFVGTSSVSSAVFVRTTRHLCLTHLSFTASLYQNESWELAERRWGKLLHDFRRHPSSEEVCQVENAILKLLRVDPVRHLQDSRHLRQCQVRHGAQSRAVLQPRGAVRAHVPVCEECRRCARAVRVRHQARWQAHHRTGATMLSYNFQVHL